MKGLNFKFSWKQQKTDFILILFLSFFIFLWDITMNKGADLGINYLVHITQTLQTSAVNLMWIAGTSIVILLGILTYRATHNRKGSDVMDFIVGVFSFFCFAFLILGGVLQLLRVEQFPIFIWTIYTITAYHWIAIFGLIFTMIYFVTTE